MSTNEMKPHNKRSHDTLVDRYREATRAVDETPNPRVRGAVLAEAHRLAREQRSPKVNEVLTKKRAANDGRWRYAAAASILTAGIAAFVVNQWQSGETELVVNEAPAAASAPGSGSVSASPPAASPANKPTLADATSSSVAAPQSLPAKAKASEELAAASLPKVTTAPPVVAAASDKSVSSAQAKTETIRRSESVLEKSAGIRRESSDTARIASAPTSSPAETNAAKSFDALNEPLRRQDEAVVASAKRAKASEPPMAAAAPIPPPAAPAAPAAPRAAAAASSVPLSDSSVAQSARSSTGAAFAKDTDQESRIAKPEAKRVESAGLATSSAPAVAANDSRARPAPAAASAGAAAPAPPAVARAPSETRVGEMTPGMQRGMAQMRATIALRDAVRANDLAAVREALRAGADANATDANGGTTLVQAVRAGNVEMVIELMRAGVDANRRDNAGLSARDYAERSGNRAIIDAVNR